jgi:hypothetical protein
MKRLLILFSLAIIMTGRAFAGTITVSDGQEVIVGVDPLAGVTIQLPTFVRVVTPPRQFVVVPIQAPTPPPTNGGSQEVAGSSDVRAFLIKSNGRTNGEERITFMLADERTVTIHFRAQMGSDNFVDLRYPRQNQTSRSKMDSGFLASERNLMLTLLKDEQGAGRQVVNTEIKLDRYPDLRIILLRQFQSDGLTGYVFSVTNMGGQTLQINPTVLAIGQPNRAILTQLDHEILKPCKLDNSADPRGTGCMTALRMVVRGQNQGLPTLAGIRSAMPFVAIAKDAKELP